MTNHREAPVPFVSEDAKKSTFSTTMTRLKKEMTSGRLDMTGGDDKQESINLPAKGDASGMPSSQLNDFDLETLAQMSLGMLEGKARDTNRELEPRKKSLTMPQSMLVFSSNSSFGPAVSMSSGMAAMGGATGMLNMAHLTGNLGKMQQSMQQSVSSSHSASSGKMTIEVTETTEPIPAHTTPRRPSQSQQGQPQLQQHHPVEKPVGHLPPLHQPAHLPPLRQLSASPRNSGGGRADDEGGPSIV